MMDNEQLGQALLSHLQLLQTQLDELKKAPALNGKFKELVHDVGEMKKGLERMEGLLINPDTGDGLVSRVKEIESYIDRREEFMAKDVYPAMESFAKMQSQMDLQVKPVIEAHDQLKQEVAELKLKQAIQAKIGWGLGLATGSMLLKAVMDMVLTSSGS